MDAGVASVIPWIRALPDRDPLEFSLTELGEVKIYLYACEGWEVVHQMYLSSN